MLQSKRQLIRPEIIDRVADRMGFLYQHNDWNRVRAVINGMTLFVRSVPNVKMKAGNSTLLSDNQESTQAMCRIIGRHLAFARTLPPERLPYRVPLLFYGGQMHAHPYHVPGSFNYVKKVDDAGVVVIPYGNGDDGNQLVDPPVIQTPAIPAPTTTPGSTPGTGTGSGSDPSAALLQGVLGAMNCMTQLHVQSDRHNASMSQQQAKLQAATLQSQAQLLENLTRNLGNLGYEVGRAIASHPTQHSHTLRATLSHPNAVVGQSNDPEVLGSLTRAIPVGMSVESFDYGPYVQAFQPQPNDKNTRRIDEATHNITQRGLPDSVKDRYDAAHTSGVVLPVSDYLGGFVYVVEIAIDQLHRIVRKFLWHPSLGTGCITSSGFVLQPNIQERDFARYAPYLENLDLSTVRMF